MKFITIVLILSTVIYTGNSLCNTCSATSGLACVAENKFKVCVDGMPTSSAIQCPDGTVCTPNAQVCAPIGSTPSSCARCNVCSTEKIFACIASNAFTLCYGGPTPDDKTTFLCPQDLVCNLDSPNICVDKHTTGLGATCPEIEVRTLPPTSEPTITTTPSPELQPNEYCEYKGYPGRYEIFADKTCLKYISCVLLGDDWVGNLYECPKATFFNPAKQMCGSEKPPRC